MHRSGLLLFCIVLIFSDSFSQQDSSVMEEVNQLKNEVLQLKQVVAELKEQVQNLEFSLKTNTTNILSEQSLPVSEPAKDINASHWCTKSNNKRHNSSCRYYKKSAGRPCGSHEGIPCKICGG